MRTNAPLSPTRKSLVRAAGVAGATLALLAACSSARDTSQPSCIVRLTDQGRTEVVRSPDGRSVVKRVATMTGSSSALDLEVDVHDQLYVHAVSVTDAKGSHTTIAYGPMVHGVHEMDLWTVDGKTLTGVVDGHPLVPFQKGQTLSFADARQRRS